MRRVSILLASVLALTLVVPGLASAVPRQQFEHYVALGDSYTAGPFIPWQRLDPLGCARSTNNYPSMLARELGTRSFTDESCSGADTTHLTQRQQVPLGVNAPQFDALRPDTDLVTLGIGGNDHGVFGDIVGVCPALRGSDPTGTPCQDHFTVDGEDTLKAAIADTGERVTEVLAGIHERSPQATVLVIGYPRIAPPSGTCPAVLPFADGDYAWLDDIEQTLNAALAKAVADDGAATFVDLYPPSLGHDACAGGDAWIQGQHTNPFAAASYHPNRAGMAGVAAEVAATLG
ncbi:SGNH/GDSL hydrolase family protein [Prauserella cavernicola]|uniref:SGNH/GDSL hydrolase family protein n=1 Tax=Prauserella cavernicola TaxID=2800127 RepID=A0A934V6P1_9PSEU|nr:SGNH/GDSL hydrolase family protein [Prauserella cavernicola]MBK1786415.1 SGNH/GDSL hydrolase family protein [Prauserella cavernicola]